MMLRARSMLHSRLPPAVFVAQPAKKRSLPWGPAISQVACATLDPRPSWPGRGGGGQGEPGTPRSDEERPRGRGTSDAFQYLLQQASRDPITLTGAIKACEDLTSLEELALSHGHLFNHIHVSAMMNRVAKAYSRGDNAVKAKHLMLRLSARALERVDAMDARPIASILWSVGKVGGINDASFISSWLLVARVQLPEFNSLDLANSLWSAATLGIRDELFMSSWLLAAKVKLLEFNAQELANCLWAVAELSIRDEPFISSWLLAAKAKLPEFKSQELANSLLAAAKLGISRDEPFISSCVLAAKVMLPQFNAQDLANSLWAVATLGIRDEPFISSWLLAAKVKLPQFNAQALANSLWAVAKLGIRDEPFFSSWLLAASLKRSEFKALEMSSNRWATSKLGIHWP